MSALGWELPLDVICVNGSFAQKVYFAKLHERPKAIVDHNRLMLRPQPALGTFMQDAAFQSPLNGYCFFLQR
ncbi:hypothetical protein [Sulfitobacter sp.]|uniref:hypothetical protein n=1 Tax=Sulfitobacter sp. TaxID=1903071 RepID=UPI003002BEF7